MAGLGVVDVSQTVCHIPSFPLLKPNFRGRCSYGQVFASCDATSFLRQSSQSYQFGYSQRSRLRGRVGREEVAVRLQCCTAIQTRCRTFGNWNVAQRGRVNHDRVTTRGEGLGRVGSNWPLSGQCCIVSNFCQQVPRSRVKRNFKVRCEGESASTYGFGNDTVTCSEAGETLGQGGDGAERESVSPIALEQSLSNNSVDDGYQRLRVNEGLLKTLFIERTNFYMKDDSNLQNVLMSPLCSYFLLETHGVSFIRKFIN